MQRELISTEQIDQSLEASDNFLIDVQMEAMENDGYKVSKALESMVNRTRVEAFDLEDNYSKGELYYSIYLILHALYITTS